MLAMVAVRTLPALFLMGIAASFASLAQEAPRSPRPAYDGSASLYAPKKIYVDQNCRILPEPAQRIPGKKLRSYKDPVICHLETILSSEHQEERIVGNQLQRFWVRIAEQEYVLQNIADGPVIFVVEQSLPKDWTVDSDPQPEKVADSIAIFSVHAAPGEIVRLHVGLRHTSTLRPKQIGVPSEAPSRSAANS